MDEALVGELPAMVVADDVLDILDRAVVVGGHRFLLSRQCCSTVGSALGSRAGRHIDFDVKIIMRADYGGGMRPGVGIVDTMIGFPVDPGPALRHDASAVAPRRGVEGIVHDAGLLHVPRRSRARRGGRPRRGDARRDGPFRRRGRSRQPHRRARGGRARAHARIPAGSWRRTRPTRTGAWTTSATSSRRPREVGCPRGVGVPPRCCRHRSRSTRRGCTRCTRSASSSGLPLFMTVGIAGPRVPSLCQKVELLDQVMYDFPDLVVVMRHGAEPWVDLAVKLMLKWPNLHYSTSAFAPRYYPRDHRLRQHPRRQPGHVRRLLPDGAVARADHVGTRRRTVPRRRVPGVPPRQRAAGARTRRPNGSTGGTMSEVTGRGNPTGVVVITGTGGMGRAIAHRLAPGRHVVLADRRRGRARRRVGCAHRDRSRRDDAARRRVGR